MLVYYTGINASPLFSDQDGIIPSVSHLTQIPFSEITDIEIGWNYFLLWKDTQLYVTGKISENDDKNNPYLMQIPEELSGRLKKKTRNTECFFFTFNIFLFYILFLSFSLYI